MAQVILDRWGSNTELALATWQSRLPQHLAAVAEQYIEAGRDKAAATVEQCAGRAPKLSAGGSQESAAEPNLILSPPGAEDQERPEVQPGLQALLANIPARIRMDQIEKQLLEARDVPGLELLKDLRAEGTNH